MPWFRIPGITIERDPEPHLAGFLRIKKVSSHEILVTRDVRSGPETVEAPEDSLVRIEYENDLCERLNRVLKNSIISPRSPCKFVFSSFRVR